MATNVLIGIGSREDVAGAKSFVRSIAVSIMHENCFYKFDMKSLYYAAQAVGTLLKQSQELRSAFIKREVRSYLE